jgi:hypothetical protein
MIFFKDLASQRLAATAKILDALARRGNVP